MESGLLGSYLFLCALVAVGVALLSYRYLGNQLWGKLVPQRLGVALLDERGNFWYRNAYLREEIERRHRYSLSAGLLNDPYLREFWRQLEGENQLGELPISIDGQVYNLLLLHTGRRLWGRRIYLAIIQPEEEERMEVLTQNVDALRLEENIAQNRLLEFCQRQFLERVKVGVLVVSKDASRRIIYANPYLQTILTQSGVLTATEEQFLGESLTNLAPRQAKKHTFWHGLGEHLEASQTSPQSGFYKSVLSLLDAKSRWSNLQLATYVGRLGGAAHSGLNYSITFIYDESCQAQYEPWGDHWLLVQALAEEIPRPLLVWDPKVQQTLFTNAYYRRLRGLKLEAGQLWEEMGLDSLLSPAEGRKWRHLELSLPYPHKLELYYLMSEPQSDYQQRQSGLMLYNALLNLQESKSYYQALDTLWEGLKGILRVEGISCFQVRPGQEAQQLLSAPLQRSTPTPWPEKFELPRELWELIESSSALYTEELPPAWRQWASQGIWSQVALWVPLSYEYGRWRGLIVIEGGKERPGWRLSDFEEESLEAALALARFLLNYWERAVVQERTQQEAQSLLELSPHPLAVVDGEGKSYFLNRAGRLLRERSALERLQGGKERPLAHLLKALESLEAKEATLAKAESEYRSAPLPGSFAEERYQLVARPLPSLEGGGHTETVYLKELLDISEQESCLRWKQRLAELFIFSPWPLALHWAGAEGRRVLRLSASYATNYADYQYKGREALELVDDLPLERLEKEREGVALEVLLKPAQPGNRELRLVRHIVPLEAEEYLQVLEQPPGRLYLEWDREVTFYERSRASLYFASYLLSIPYLQLVERDFRASLATALSNARELLHAPGVALVWMESPSSLLAAGSVALYWGTEHGGQWREEGELSSSELKLLERFKDPSSPYSQTLAHRARAEQIAELNSLWDCEYSAWIEVALDLAPQTRCWLALAMQAPGAEVDDFYLKAWADLAQIMHFICLYHLSFVRWQRGVKDFKRVHSSEDKLMSQADHAIRQPLNVVISAAEILSDRQFYDNLSAEERREWVSNIHNYGQVLLQLVNDILDYSKLKAGHMKFTPYPLPLPAFMESIVAPYRKEALAKGLEFRLNLETQATILLNGQRLGQVLDNLLSNAVKFTEEGGIIVTLAWTLEEGDPNYGRFGVSVEDSGPGIAPENLSKIYEPFALQGAWGGTSGHFTGTGLGLAIAQATVELLDGKLECQVKAAPGRGCIFSLLLPHLEVWHESN